jgi:hypothetical protein
LKTEQQNVNERRHERLGARTAFAKVAFGQSEQGCFHHRVPVTYITDQALPDQSESRVFSETAMRQH